MRVKFLTALAGARFSHAAGAIVDLPEETARGFIEGGVAIDVPADDVALGRIEDARALFEAKKADLKGQIAALSAENAELKARLAEVAKASADPKPASRRLAKGR